MGGGEECDKKKVGGKTEEKAGQENWDGNLLELRVEAQYGGECKGAVAPLAGKALHDAMIEAKREGESDEADSDSGSHRLLHLDSRRNRSENQ